MKSSFPLLLVAALASSALAQVKSITAVKCFTKLSPASKSNVPTASFVLTIPLYATARQTITPTLTITPAAITSVTASFVKETSISSNIHFITVTSSATTIGTTAGFVPIESSFPGSGDTPAQKRSFIDSSVADAPLQARAGTTLCIFQNDKPVFSPPRYQSAVKCVGAVFVVSTKTATFTATRTVTTTLPPATVFTTDVSKTTVLVTVDVTNTTIVPNPTPIYYAACAENNIINTAQGVSIAAVSITDFSTGPNTAIVDATSPYDCCAQCQAYAASNGGAPCSSSYYSIGTESNTCLLVVGNGCTRSRPVPFSTGGCNSLYVSNGCDQISSFRPGTPGSC